ncbi:BAR adaptor protein Hob3 [Dimargaris xerosporica]|nr:BAR adaptor protein Hob3 [Dimargaris xerosporica]
MSWSGFKKTVNRTGISLMQGFGAIDKTVDKDFQEKEAMFKCLQSKSDELHRQARGYLNSVRAMTNAQVHMAEHLDGFYEESTAGAAGALHYRRAMSEIDATVRTEFDEVYRETVLSPIGRYCGYIPEFNTAINKRGRKLLDYDQAKSKLKKTIDRPTDDVNRAPQAEQAANNAREMYTVLNQQLLDEIPRFINIRVPYLEPSFEAMLKTQLKFFEDSYTLLQEVGTKLPVDAPGMDVTNERGVNEQVEDTLDLLRNLSICGMLHRPTAAIAKQ